MQALTDLPRLSMQVHGCRLLGTPFAADLESGHCYTTLSGAKLVASCGYWDNSVRCYSVEDGRLLQSLRQHKDIVTCIAVGADGETLVTGDTCCCCAAVAWVCPGICLYSAQHVAAAPDGAVEGLIG